MVKLLLDRGADLDVTFGDGCGNFGDTVLSVATRYGHNRKIADLLIDKGADIDAAILAEKNSFLPGAHRAN